MKINTTQNKPSVHSGTPEAYLENKYNKNFTYISDGKDLWSSNTKTYIYSDTEQNSFSVKETSGYYTDNYCSAVFDKVASEYVANALTPHAKAFINTESVYLGSAESYSDFSEYLAECSVINLVIYTTDSNYDYIADKVSSALEDGYVSALIHVVSTDTFDIISGYKDSVSTMETESFQVSDGTVLSKSWEA